MHVRLPHAGERMIRVLCGQATALPASLFDLGISPTINASIVMGIVFMLPPDMLALWPWLRRLADARKEGKSVS